MNKADLVKLIHPNDQHINNHWKEAVRLYKEAHPQSDVSAGCRGCREKVYKWLKE